MQTSRQPQHWGEKTPAYTQPHQEYQVENFASYRTHAKSPPSYQQCMMMLSPPGAQIVVEEEDDVNFSNHSRTCQQAIALFLLLFLILLIFCWIALLLDGTLFWYFDTEKMFLLLLLHFVEYKESHNYQSTSSSAPSFKSYTSTWWTLNNLTVMRIM